MLTRAIFGHFSEETLLRTAPFAETDRDIWQLFAGDARAGLFGWCYCDEFQRL
jgi:hypothetical protein